MPYLFLVALIWSFSFSFTEVYLSKQVDPWFVVFIRVVFALIVFLPFLKIKGMSLKQAVLFIGVGASQLGIMYFFYYHAYLYISVPEILLFKVMTPVYVTLLYDLFHRRSLRLPYLFTALMAVCGAAVIHYDKISNEFMIGFLLIQAANFFFALGQVGYKRILEVYPIAQHQAFSWVYVGAVMVASCGWILFGDNTKLPTNCNQWFVLLWLGVISSGLCYFLWNYGSTQTDAGSLAIMNNLIIPLGILVNLLVQDKSLEWPKFLTGSALIVGAIVIHKFYIVRRRGGALYS